MSAQTDIATDLTRILGAKSDLKTSIEGKGVTVPSATKIDGYAALVDQIQQGGGGHTGTVDTVGLQALGWDSDDIQWLQDHVWWDAEDDAEWAVTEANKAFGPNGATPLAWNTRSSIQYNPDCRYLPKLTLPNNLTSMFYVFSGYYHLVAIPTHGWDMTAITNFRYCFPDCYSLRSVGDISYWVTASVTTAEFMFANCCSLEELDVSHWNTSNVETFQKCFASCYSLKKLDISGWSFAKATTIIRMFSECTSLESVTLPATINAPYLTDISYCFERCYNLADISIRLSAAAVTTARDMFLYCECLQKALVSISSAALSNVLEMFSYCFLLTNVDLEIDTTSVAQAGIGTGFSACPVGYLRTASIIKLGANFFKGTFTTLYMQQAYSWTRDSIYESLYTNQTSRNSNSNAVTVKLATQAYDRLSAQDISDIATKNITLTRG